MRLEDGEIIAQVLSGERDAFELVIRKYQRKVYTLILRLVKDREAALDLSQEVFFKVYQRLSDLKDHAKASSWIMQVAHNAALDHLKKRRVDSFSTDFEDQQTQQKLHGHLVDSSTPSPEELVERMTPSRLAQIVDKLDIKYRTVITLRFIEGFSFKEIAKIMELPLTTVKFRKHYALGLIRDRWLRSARDGED